ncbi:prephenate dehydrogenase [Reichenbachiella carrageenanivorans]|uniref:Prephenate dehydrogenase n=1 Tax=Reichenbachiella carrageenanivorans TaxID=2979869 RepID=A0ABY6CWB6_9BACT|nr:prephenate dehydrogenase [Reichenbachiella carrageenanivorans]UXX78209.1 prephenate dehydrogenase [Reichenbachiella carrageenanivorans]
MIVSIIGLGLIGGSVALKLKKSGFADQVIGVDLNDEHADMAKKMGLVDDCLVLPQALSIADLVILAIPVDSIRKLLPSVLDRIDERTTVIDLGSTKSGICEAVLGHPNRKNFVAAHPIAGTENSGPEAAFDSLFDGKTGIICDADESQQASFLLAKACLEALDMHVVEMGSKSHDLHIAYVSHLSHISSFVLGQTVLEIEKDEATIFNMAGSGFESTVRLAKSSPQMWAPIFKQNQKHISASLGAYIENLQAFKNMIDSGEEDAMIDCMKNANDIRRVLDGINDKSNKKETLNQII